ncbi:MAG: hypothetical protein KME54_27665 [Tolypothrix brevis GSE-NOS-MK-07-07A]|jgi:hypothetical protein|nr:hypothetical protein [Tolypothrix brevis GSE-NOS-MK-07-07A]
MKDEYSSRVKPEVTGMIDDISSKLALSAVSGFKLTFHTTYTIKLSSLDDLIGYLRQNPALLIRCMKMILRSGQNP